MLCNDLRKPDAPTSQTHRLWQWLKRAGVWAVPIGAVAVPLWGLYVAQLQIRAEDRKNEIQDWQQLRILGIIEKSLYGVTFDEIRSLYLDEVSSEQNIEIPKKELHPDSLREIIISLQMNGLVTRLSGNRYFANHSMLSPRVGRSLIEEQGKMALLKLLESEGGNYTTTEIQLKVPESLALTPEECIKTANEMLAADLMSIDKNNKVWSAAKPAPPELRLPN